MLLIFTLFALSFAQDYNARHYTTCYGGMELPSVDPLTGRCQLDTECSQPCLVICSAARLVASGYYCATVKRKDNSHKYTKRYSAQTKECRCCCTSLPICQFGRLQVASQNALAFACNNIAGECNDRCSHSSVSPCVTNSPPGFVGTFSGASHCLISEGARGYSGICGCCCSFTVSSAPPSSPPCVPPSSVTYSITAASENLNGPVGLTKVATTAGSGSVAVSTNGQPTTITLQSGTYLGGGEGFTTLTTTTLSETLTVNDIAQTFNLVADLTPTAIEGTAPVNLDFRSSLASFPLPCGLTLTVATIQLPLRPGDFPDPTYSSLSFNLQAHLTITKQQ